MTRPRTAIAALALAEAVSLSGTRLSTVAIPWLVLTLTGDPVRTGIVGLAEMLPYVVAKALGGPLIDRLGPRRISIAADLASMLVVAGVPLLHALGALRFEALIPIVILLGALRGPADAAKQAMVPAMAAGAGLPLERLTGIMGTLERFASVIGAALAGLLVAAIGAAPALIVNALTCGLAALIMRLGLGDAAPAAAPSLPYLAELRAGWRQFRADPVLIGIALMVACTNLLDQAFGAVLLPVWASLAGDAALLGLVLAIFSGASMAGAALATLIGEKLPRLVTYVVAFIVTGAPRFVVFALDTPFAALVAVLAAAGFASGFLNPIIGAVMFERIPPAFVGRVSALVNALCWVLLPFGGLVGGVLIATIGLNAAFVATGLAYLLVTMLPLARRSFRAFDQRPRLATPPG